MNEQAKALKETMCKDIDGANFFFKYHRNGQEIDKLTKDVLNLIVEHSMTVSEIKGFLEYMKIIVDNRSYLPQRK